MHRLPPDVAGAPEGLIMPDEVFPLGVKIDLRNDSVAFVCAKVRKWYRQRIEFPVPLDVQHIIQKRKMAGQGWIINGIFCGLFKTGPNPKNPFFGGMSLNGEQFIDWKICLRDVLVKNDHGDEYMLFSRRRQRNKQHRIEFSIRDLMQAFVDEDHRRAAMNAKYSEKISEHDVRAALERAVEARAVAKAQGIDLDDD